MIQPKIVGKNENVLQCILEDKQGNRMKAVYFGDVKDLPEKRCWQEKSPRLLIFRQLTNIWADEAYSLRL